MPGTRPDGIRLTASMDSGTRPSQSKGRRRVRSICVVSRDGPVASGVHAAGGELTPMPDHVVGMIPDALRRALRLPTAPPDLPVTEYFASLLLGRIINDADQSGLRIGLAEIRPQLAELDELAGQATWECIRSAVAHADPHPQNPLDPNLAEAFRVLRYVQRFGVGIPTARRELAANGNPPPEFHLEPTQVTAIVRPTTNPGAPLP